MNAQQPLQHNSITLSEWKQQSSNKRGKKRTAEMFTMAA